MRSIYTSVFMHKPSWSCLAALLLMLGACQKDMSEKVSRAMPEKSLSDKIFLTQGGQPQRVPVIRLSKDTVYVLSEPFRRLQGEQLIVEAGTLIKVVPGVDIIIEPGGWIEANGTEASPVVFTSNLPRASAAAAWNGIILQGEDSSNQVSTPGQVNDTTGRLTYVRIEFGSLVLLNAGTGNVVDHVQVSYTGQRPSFVFDGGSVSASRLVSYACGGPTDFYITNGYRGRLQFLLGLRHPFFGKPGSPPFASLSGLHIENNSSGNSRAIPLTNPSISNLTIIGPNGLDGMSAEFSDTSGLLQNAALVANVKAHYQIRHGLFMGYPSSAWIIGDSTSAFNLNFGRASNTNSVFQCADSYRAFYLRPDIYAPFGFGPYGPPDFQQFILNPSFKNRLFADVASIGLEDPYNDVLPKPWPAAGSILFGGTDFSGPVFSNGFFARVDFIGALGSQSWMAGWTNFTALKTSYNEPK